MSRTLAAAIAGVNDSSPQRRRTPVRASGLSGPRLTSAERSDLAFYLLSFFEGKSTHGLLRALARADDYDLIERTLASSGAAAYQRASRRLVRALLRETRSDFYSVLRLARTLAACSSEEGSLMLWALLREQCRFERDYWSAYWRLHFVAVSESARRAGALAEQLTRFLRRLAPPPPLTREPGPHF